MGLDMYLHAEKYVSGYEFRDESDRKEYAGLVEMFGAGEYVDPETPSATVSFTVAYWRKANQIHQWFVDNVQDGKDECQPHHVDRAQLRDLRELCLRVIASSILMDGTVHTGTIYNKEHPQGAVQLEQGKIIADPTAAHQLLPSREGFFFGNTDYDESYMYDIRITIEQLDRALAMPDEWTFEYQSSW